jgi:hypothetical protein
MQRQFIRTSWPRPISDPFIAGLPRPRYHGMRDGEPGIVDQITAFAKKEIDIAGYKIPYWGIGAAAAGAFFFMKKR